MTLLYILACAPFVLLTGFIIYVMLDVRVLKELAVLIILLLISMGMGSAFAWGISGLTGVTP